MFLILTLIVTIITLAYASILDVKYRRVPIKTWKFIVIVGIPCLILELFYFTGNVVFIIIVSAIAASIFYIIGRLELFGGADCTVMILICILLPLFPIAPLFGYPPFLYFPFTVFSNAVFFSLFFIPWILIKRLGLKEYKIPFMIPILLGVISAATVGDIFTIILSQL